MLKNFKEFAMRGNLMDMAIGVIIGGAFGKIVSSLVNDIIMPVLSLLTGGINVSDWKIVITPATETAAETAFRYGAFIQSIIDFLIIAFSIFLFINMMNKLRRKKEEAPAEPPAPSREEQLLEEIRDILKSER